MTLQDFEGIERKSEAEIENLLMIPPTRCFDLPLPQLLVSENSGNLVGRVGQVLAT